MRDVSSRALEMSLSGGSGNTIKFVIPTGNRGQYLNTR
jgi:hypothetical protein